MSTFVHTYNFIINSSLANLISQPGNDSERDSQSNKVREREREREDKGDRGGMWDK